MSSVIGQTVQLTKDVHDGSDSISAGSIGTIISIHETAEEIDNRPKGSIGYIVEFPTIHFIWLCFPDEISFDIVRPELSKIEDESTYL